MTLVLLTYTIVDGSGTPVPQGHVTFALSAESNLPASKLVISEGQVRTVLNSAGQIVGPTGQPGVTLFANDSTGINPSGTYYVVTEVLAGGLTTQYGITITSSMAPTVDMSTLTRTVIPS